MTKILVKDLEVKGKKGSKRLDVLFDSGAAFNLIKRDKADFCDIEKIEFPEGERVEKPKSVTGDELDITGYCSFETVVEGKGQFQTRIIDTLIISDNFNDPDIDMIIGAPTLERYKIGLDFDIAKENNGLNLSQSRNKVILLGK
jgi:hypothetical protein